MKRSVISYLVLAVLLVVTVWIALTNGASHFSLLKMTATDANTLFNIRLPRIITALMAGAMLSVSGAFFQAALRNPIADPGIMGSRPAPPYSPLSGRSCCRAFSLARFSSPLSAGRSP